MKFISAEHVLFGWSFAMSEMIWSFETHYFSSPRWIHQLDFQTGLPASIESGHWKHDPSGVGFWAQLESPKFDGEHFIGHGIFCTRFPNKKGVPVDIVGMDPLGQDLLSKKSWSEKLSGLLQALKFCRILALLICWRQGWSWLHECSFQSFPLEFFERMHAKHCYELHAWNRIELETGEAAKYRDWTAWHPEMLLFIDSLFSPWFCLK